MDGINQLHYSQLRASLNDQVWITLIEASNSDVSVVDESEILPPAPSMAITQVAPDFLEIFQPQVTAGDVSEFSTKSDVAFISKSIAEQIFGHEDAVGKLVQFRLSPTVDQRQTGELPTMQQVRIIAVVDIDNSRSHIRPAIFFPRLQDPPMSADGTYFVSEAYIKSKVGLTSSHIETLLNKVGDSLSADKQENSTRHVKYSVMPITKRHMDDTSSEGNRARVVILSLLGLVILIVAIGNFISLGLAGYVARQKEVALRRIQGAGKGQLLLQYWLENLVHVAAAFLLALIICELTMPHLAGLLQFPLVGGIFVSPILVLICTAMVILVSLVIACYPAIYFSHVNPSAILRANRSSETGASILTRRVLLLVQFVAVALLVIGLMAIHMQLKLMNQYDPGYKTEGIVMFYSREGGGLSGTQREAFKQELAKMPGFIGATSVLGVIPGENESITDISAMVGDGLREHKVIYDWISDADYFDTYGIRLIAGSKENIISSFNKSRSPDKGDPPMDIILCRATASALGFSSPQDAINKTVNVFAQPGTPYAPSAKIIGVVENFHMGDHRKAPTDCIHGTLNIPGLAGMPFAISFNRELSTSEIEAIKNLWASMAGATPHHWLFENSLADRYKNEQRLQLFMSGFALVALLIGLLGIYGITALNTQKRAREIALRKLHGAKQWAIISLLNREFSLMVLLANIIAWPMAIYAVRKWLENFHQHFSFALWLPVFCVGALAISLLIVWITVSLHTLSIDRLRPAEVLRDE